MILAASTTVVEFPELGIGPFTMDRFLVKDLFGFLNVAWYGLIICIGMILACALVLRNAVRKEGFLLDSFLDYFIVCIPLGVVGARCMYVLANLEDYETFLEAVSIWKGGLAIYGAVITGAAAVLVLSRIKKDSPLKIFDAMVPGLLLAQAIGRWGNFVNGEAYGETMETALPWGMIVNGHGPVHPTFLYESLITFSGFLLASFLIYRNKRFDGQLFCFYLVWYGIGRVAVEGLRTDSLMIGPLRLAQCIGTLSALLGVVLFFVLRRNQKKICKSPQNQADLSEKEENEPVLTQEKEMENGTDH